MKYKKKFTVNEWKKFDKFSGKIILGYELTYQEILLRKYKIILTDHKNTWRAGVFCPIPLKERLRAIPSMLTDTNFKKCMKAFDNGMAQFDKILSTFTSGFGDMGKAGRDLNSLGGANHVKIWSNRKPSKRTSKKDTSNNQVPLWTKRKVHNRKTAIYSNDKPSVW